MVRPERFELPTYSSGGNLEPLGQPGISELQRAQWAVERHYRLPLNTFCTQREVADDEPTTSLLRKMASTSLSCAQSRVSSRSRYKTVQFRLAGRVASTVFPACGETEFPTVGAFGEISQTS
jgi:hypothetical protein